MNDPLPNVSTTLWARGLKRSFDLVGGIAILIFLYFLIHKLNGWKVDQACVRALGKYLWGFMIFAVSLELLEVLSVAYKQTEEWEVLLSEGTGLRAGAGADDWVRANAARIAACLPACAPDRTALAAQIGLEEA